MTRRRAGIPRRPGWVNVALALCVAALVAMVVTQLGGGGPADGWLIIGGVVALLLAAAGFAKGGWS